MTGPIIFSLVVLLVSLFIRAFRPKHESNKIISPPKQTPPSVIINRISAEKRRERMLAAAELTADNPDLSHRIPLPESVQLIETGGFLLIKGPVSELSDICDQISLFDQVPESYCMQLGDWQFFSLESMRESSREEKLVIMPRDHWLFASCKLRDSILGYDVHPYNYVYEPFTFEVVLDYGIGIEATDWKAFDAES